MVHVWGVAENYSYDKTRASDIYYFETYVLVRQKSQTRIVSCRC